MPELPEVETTRRGLAPHVLGRRVSAVIVRKRQLRWAIPRALEARLPGQEIRSLTRRAKYLLTTTDAGTMIAHLGMSGSFRVVRAGHPCGAHDHVDIVLDSGWALRYNDPRRFGCLLWTRGDPLHHKLLRSLGPEPLEQGFDGDYLYRISRGRKASVKPFLMDAHVVVGVGNIYASECLHRAGIHPRRPAGRVGLDRMRGLAQAVQQVLNQAIQAGGTTLRDFVREDGQPGYFAQSLLVYGRAGLPCFTCGQAIRQEVMGQRASYFCPGCQR
jgi:formamidopyrimidine-DNA glycosylase